jgi:hypothetical protein
LTKCRQGPIRLPGSPDSRGKERPLGVLRKVDGVHVSQEQNLIGPAPLDDIHRKQLLTAVETLEDRGYRFSMEYIMDYLYKDHDIE